MGSFAFRDYPDRTKVVKSERNNDVTIFGTRVTCFHLLDLSMIDLTSTSNCYNCYDCYYCSNCCNCSEIC